jgi:hypothetical protein
MGREVIDPPPLSMEERAELDRKAMELGLIEPGAAGEPMLYATMEEALRAAGVDPNAAPAPTADPVEALQFARQSPRPRGGYLPPPVEIKVVETARLPDFTKVQGMDLQKGVAYLDSMEFQIPAENLRKLRQFVVELARRAMMQKLEEAVGLFARETPNGQGAAESTGEAVQRFPEGSSS